MAEGDRRILDLRVARSGFHQKDNNALVTFSVRDHRLVRTVIPQCGVRRLSLYPSRSSLDLGNHSVADDLRGLGLSKKPFMSFAYSERAAILPAGEVLETGVRPLAGYAGLNREGTHLLRYAD